MNDGFLNGERNGATARGVPLDSGDQAGRRSLEDDWIDAVVPETVDWKELVREHPFASLGTVAVVSFLVGRLHGERVVELGRNVLNQKIDESLHAYGLFVEGRSGDDVPPGDL